MRSIVFFLVVSVAAILIAGCDPGIAYKPANWKHLRNFEFTNKYDGFDLELRGFQGFIGSKGDITEALWGRLGRDGHATRVATLAPIRPPCS